jgi:hypothetical protein
MTFREQRHRQKNRGGSGGKSHADFGVVVDAKAPFQGRADIVETGEVGCPFHSGRQGRPIGPGLLQPSPVISRVTHGQVSGLAVVNAHFEGVSASRVQQPVAHHGPHGAGRDHRLRDEAVDGAENTRLIEGRAGHDGQNRIEREMPNEYREPAQHLAFCFGKQPVAPVQRGMQRLLTRRRGARPHPQQRQPLVEKGGGLMQAVGFDPSCGQLNRQRHAIQLSADAYHDRGFRIAEVEVRAARHRAFDKQLWRGERLCHGCREPRIVRWTGKRIQSVDVLPLDLESLATCRRDVDLRCGHDDSRRSAATASIRCSQVSRIKKIRLSRRYAMRLGATSADRTDSPSMEATAVATRTGSFSMLRSTKSTAPEKASIK